MIRDLVKIDCVSVYVCFMLRTLTWELFWVIWRKYYDGILSVFFNKGVIIAPKAKWFIVWFAEGVDRQNSGMWLLCAKHLIQHLVIDSRVFSLGDFVLERLFCAQRL